MISLSEILEIFFGGVLFTGVIALVGSFLCYRRCSLAEDPVLRVHKKKNLEVALFWLVVVICVVILWNFSQISSLTLAGE